MHAEAACRSFWRLFGQFCTLGQLSENASEWKIPLIICRCAMKTWMVTLAHLKSIFFNITTTSALLICLSACLVELISLATYNHVDKHISFDSCSNYFAFLGKLYDHCVVFLSFLGSASSWLMASWPPWFCFWWWSWRSVL